jgi:hypothetical protein
MGARLHRGARSRQSEVPIASDVDVRGTPERGQPKPDPRDGELGLPEPSTLHLVAGSPPDHVWRLNQMLPGPVEKLAPCPETVTLFPALVIAIPS